MSPLKEATPLVKVTVAPAPMFSAASVWLTLPNFTVLPAPAFTVEAPVPMALFTLVVPAFAVSVT